MLAPMRPTALKQRRFRIEKVAPLPQVPLHFQPRILESASLYKEGVSERSIVFT